MPEDEAKLKDELIQLIKNVEDGAKEVEAVGQNLVASARFARDMSGPLVELIQAVLPNQLPQSEWSRQIESAKAWQGTMVVARAIRLNADFFQGTTSSSVNTCISGVMDLYGGCPPAYLPPPVAQA